MFLFLYFSRTVTLEFCHLAKCLTFCCFAILVQFIYKYYSTLL